MDLLTLKQKNLLKTAAIATPMALLAANLLTGADLHDLIDKATAREVLVRVMDWGPGFIILAALYAMARQFLGGLITSQSEIAVAMGLVSHSLEHITERDLREREEIRLTLGVLADKIERLRPHDGE